MQTGIPFGFYPHQVEGVDFLRRHGRAILADDMGLGKTRQAIVALRGASPAAPRLVICPASLKLNWEREIRMVEPATAVEVLGTKNHRLPEGVAPGWVVVNCDLLARNSARLAALASSGVIVDEAHFIKNASQRTTQILRIIGTTGDTSKRHVPPHVYLLTGTPMPSRPREFNLLRAAGHPAARSFLSFAKRYCGAYRNDIGLVIPRRKSASFEYGYVLANPSLYYFSQTVNVHVRMAMT